MNLHESLLHAGHCWLLWGWGVLRPLFNEDSVLMRFGGMPSRHVAIQLWRWDSNLWKTDSAATGEAVLPPCWRRTSSATTVLSKQLRINTHWEHAWDPGMTAVYRIDLVSVLRGGYILVEKKGINSSLHLGAVTRCRRQGEGDLENMGWPGSEGRRAGRGFGRASRTWIERQEEESSAPKKTVVGELQGIQCIEEEGGQ